MLGKQGHPVVSAVWEQSTAGCSTAEEIGAAPSVLIAHAIYYPEK